MAQKKKKDPKAEKNNAEKSYYEKQAWILGFLGATIIVGFLLPWMDHKLSSYNGLRLLSQFPDLNSNLQRAVKSQFALALVPAGGLFLLVCAGLAAFAGEQAQKLQRLLLWVQGPLLLFPMVVILLNTYSELVKQVQLVFGMQLTAAGSFVAFLHAVYSLARLDAARKLPTKFEEIWVPVTFFVVLLIAVVVNYEFINYELIPPATEILRR